MRDVRAAGVDVMTFGQYMRPTKRHMPVLEYVTPEGFERWCKLGEEMVRTRFFVSVFSGLRFSYSIQWGNNGLFC